MVLSRFGRGCLLALAGQEGPRRGTRRRAQARKCVPLPTPPTPPDGPESVWIASPLSHTRWLRRPFTPRSNHEAGDVGPESRLPSVTCESASAVGCGRCLHWQEHIERDVRQVGREACWTFWEQPEWDISPAAGRCTLEI